MIIRSTRPKTRDERCAGFTLVEVLLAVVVLVLASGAAVSSLIASRNLNEVADERAIAREAIDSKIAEMRSNDFAQVFALFNDSAADDPIGVTAPGANFAAGPLAAQFGDPDGLPGIVEFPTVAGRLREDVVDVALGMPRDLDVDGSITAADLSDTYRFLPFAVRVAWRGVKGDMVLTQHYVLTNLQ